MDSYTSSLNATKEFMHLTFSYVCARRKMCPQQLFNSFFFFFIHLLFIFILAIQSFLCSHLICFKQIRISIVKMTNERVDICISSTCSIALHCKQKMFYEKYLILFFFLCVYFAAPSNQIESNAMHEYQILQNLQCKQ